jgi:hypothetical protein
MQTLNVGAGRTDKEHREAEEQWRADLLADSRSDAKLLLLGRGFVCNRKRVVSGAQTLCFTNVYTRKSLSIWA